MPSDSTCSVVGCTRSMVARGWCHAHWRRWRRYGSPTALAPKREPTPIAERVWPNVEFTDGCWLWNGHRDSHGYGQIGVTGGRTKTLLVHRWTYEYVIGAIPDGLELDHLCRTPSCVNPWHLEPVTHVENLRRTRRDVCSRGHPFSEEGGSRTRRVCRICATRRNREYRSRRNETTVDEMRAAGRRIADDIKRRR